MGDKTKIDWCDASWNPVTGCKHGCEYCYARGIANRFRFLRDDGNLHVLNKPCVRDYYEDGEVTREDVKQPYPNGFAPTFHRYRLDIPERWTRPRTIFVCSMADLFGDWVPDEWITAVFDACLVAPQHRYLFLTKNPNRYAKLAADRKLPLNSNMWYGTSTPTPDKRYFGSNIVNAFLSIEPILAPFGGFRLKGIKWAIIGAETGNRKGKVIPKKEWVMCIANACTELGMPVFMKESLRTLMGNDFRQEFP